MLCLLSGFELYSRWVPLITGLQFAGQSRKISISGRRPLRLEVPLHLQAVFFGLITLLEVEIFLSAANSFISEFTFLKCRNINNWVEVTCNSRFMLKTSWHYMYFATKWYMVAWDDSRHFATALTVYPRNDFSAKSTSKFSTKQKHSPDLGSDVNSTEFLRSFPRRHFAWKPLVGFQILGCFLRLATWAIAETLLEIPQNVCYVFMAILYPHFIILCEKFQIKFDISTTISFNSQVKKGKVVVSWCRLKLLLVCSCFVVRTLFSVFSTFCFVSFGDCTRSQNHDSTRKVGEVLLQAYHQAIWCML